MQGAGPLSRTAAQAALAAVILPASRANGDIYDAVPSAEDVSSCASEGPVVIRGERSLSVCESSRGLNSVGY